MKARLVPGLLEESLYQNGKRVFPFSTRLIKYSRIPYLDDYWFMWKATYGDYKILLDILNNSNPAIRFAIEMSFT